MPKKVNKILTDDELIELYFDRNEAAIAETDVKYGKYIYTIAYNILSDRGDSEECKNDTYLAAWNTIPPERPRMLLPYLSRLARSKAISRHRANNAKKRSFHLSAEELTDISLDDGLRDELDAERLRRLISEFVRVLPDRERYIFVGRYYAEQKVGAIAKKLKISEPTVYRELDAIKSKLKQFLLENEVYI